MTSTDAKLYVGKEDLSEALVTGWRRISDTVQTVTVEWPDHHTFYTPIPGSYSPLLFTESVRQALALVCRTSYGIPATHRMGWARLRSETEPAALRTTGVPVRAEFRVTHSSVTRRKLGSVHFVAHVEGTVGTLRAGSAEIHYSAHPAAIYDRLRGPYAEAAHAFAQAPAPTTPLPARRVGRTDPHDVVLSPTDAPDRFRLRVDTTHPVLFDHPHDHIPGMVLLEAAGQAALATSPYPATATAFDTHFDRYVEFDAPCLLTAAPSPAGRGTRVTAHQHGHRVFTSEVTLTPTP
uniref:A-factor biosynthesis hotdog domain-containing protein n=1 Tax=Streptomyces sp. NBC_00049 TaxID=2903617 RepID=A0AAU2JS15_9ACTN